jgi:hypothetical protein
MFGRSAWMLVVFFYRGFLYYCKSNLLIAKATSTGERITRMRADLNGF